MPSSFLSKPHFIEGAVHPLTSDAVEEPPVPCDFKLGERVTFTNDSGVVFRDQLITGFSPEILNGRFVYLDFDCWWFPVKPANLAPQAQAAQAVKSLAECYALWDSFADVPVSEEDGQFIEAAFLHFDAGASREDIWRWFESLNPAFIVGEVLQGLRRTC